MSSRELMVGGKPLSSLRVVDLKVELEKFGLSKSGTKKDLADRLKTHLLKTGHQESAAPVVPAPIPPVMPDEDEQLPNISIQTKLAEDNPFIREYFASQQELFHSQNIAKKLYQAASDDNKPDTVLNKSSSPVKAEPVSSDMKSSTENSENQVAVAVPTNEDQESTSNEKNEESSTSSPPSDSIKHEETNSETVKTNSNAVLIKSPSPVRAEPVSSDSKSSTENSENQVAVAVPTNEDQESTSNEKSIENQMAIVVEPSEDQDSKSGEKAEKSPAPASSPSPEPDLIKDEETIPETVKSNAILTKSSSPERVEPVSSDIKSSTENEVAVAVSTSEDQESTSSEEAEKSPVSSPSSDSIKDEETNPETVKSNAVLTKSASPVKAEPVNSEVKNSTENQVPVAVVTTGGQEELDYGDDEEAAKEKRAIKPKLITAPSTCDWVQQYSNFEFERRKINLKPSKHTQRRLERREEEKKEAEEKKRQKEKSREFDKTPQITTKYLLDLYPDAKLISEEELNLQENPTPPAAEEKASTAIARTASQDFSPFGSQDSIEEDFHSHHTMDLTIQRKISVVSLEEETPKGLSPPRHEPTPLIVVTNLVRPFTVPQLKELLQRTGNVVDLWVDKIKSKCVAKYDTVEEATETRIALHGVKWPASNPKTLSVDYSSDNVLEELKKKDSGDAKPIPEEKPHGENRVREWDLGKRGRSRSPNGRRRSHERSRSRSRDQNKRSRLSGSPRDHRRLDSNHHDNLDRKDRTDDYYKKPESGKTLDELFRKTTTFPFIYWLPLTPQQIAEKEESRRKRMEERERRIAEMQKHRPQR